MPLQDVADVFLQIARDEGIMNTPGVLYSAHSWHGCQEVPDADPESFQGLLGEERSEALASPDPASAAETHSSLAVQGCRKLHSKSMHGQRRATQAHQESFILPRMVPGTA